MRVLPLALSCLLVGVSSLAPRVAEACSCRPEDADADHFYIDERAQLPVNAQGLTWFSGERAVGPRGKHTLEVLAEDMLLWERRVDGEWTREPVIRRLVIPRTDSATEQLVLLVPKRKFVEGDEYRVTRMRNEKEVTLTRQFTVGPAVELSPFEKVILSQMPPQTVDPLELAMNTSCSAKTIARVSESHLQLSEQLRPYRHLMVVDYEVDGKPWRPKANLCDHNYPGQPWTKVGNGHIVYSDCVEAPPVMGPAPGEHQVMAVVRLPSLGMRWGSQNVSVDLSCELKEAAEPKTIARDVVEATGLCRVSGEEQDGAMALLFLLITRRRRRPLRLAPAN